MKTLICDNCKKPCGDVKMRPGWSQLARRNGAQDPEVYHFCSDSCLIDFAGNEAWNK